MAIVLSKRYALSLFDIALEKEALEDVLATMTFLNEFFCASMVKQIMNPYHASDFFEDVLRAMEKHMKLLEFIKEFLRILKNKGYLCFFPLIYKSFLKYYDDHHNIVRVKIEASHRDDFETLKNTLQQFFKKKCIFNCIVIPNLIAGIRIETDDILIKNTLRDTLGDLKYFLI